MSELAIFSSERKGELAPNAKQDLRTQVELLQAGLFESPDQVEMPLQHFFLEKIYVRRIFMKANTVVVSKIHKLESFSIISKGTVIIATEAGPITAHAGAHFFAPAGTKRALVTVTDVVWSTVHLNLDNCQDLKILEARYITPETRELEAHEVKELYEVET